MRKIKLIIIRIILPLWFIGVEDVYGQNDDSIKEYRIERITKRNNWYFIYASRNDSLFKIVSKRTADKWKYARYDKIRRHKKYYLILESYSDNAPIRFCACPSSQPWDTNGTKGGTFPPFAGVGARAGTPARQGAHSLKCSASANRRTHIIKRDAVTRR